MVRIRICERQGCSNKFVASDPRKSYTRRFCCAACAQSPQLNQSQRDYLDAFTAWLKDPSLEHELEKLVKFSSVIEGTWERGPNPESPERPAP